MKYNLRKIMLAAWKNYRKHEISFAEALRRAWISAKAEPINAKRIADAAAAAGIFEPVNTWAGWSRVGYEVIHGMKALFTAVLIYGSRGAGATYKASFFSASQVREVVAGAGVVL